MLCAAAAAAASLAAAQPAPGPMTLPGLVEAALRDNAKLAAARAAWQAAQEMPRQERSLPNPVFTFRWEGMQSASAGSGDTSYEVEQAFPWPGKRGFRGRMAQKDAEGMGLDYEAMRREVSRMVKETYYDLCATRKAIAIVQAEENVLKRMLSVAEAKYAAGDVSQQDVAKAGAETSMLRGRQLEMEARQAGLAARLNVLLNRAADSPLDVLAQPPARREMPDAAKCARLAREKRPDVQAAASQIERDLARRGLMRREYYPDLMAGVQYRQTAAGEDMAMVMVGMDLPIHVGKAAAGVRETERQTEASRAAAADAEREAEFDARDAWARLDAARRTLELYENELVPQAQLRFDSSESGYRTGKVDFMDLLESERFLLDARLMRAMAEGDVGMQGARLDWACGADPGP
jgi:outer membrane protein TolC